MDESVARECRQWGDFKDSVVERLWAKLRSEIADPGRRRPGNRTPEMPIQGLKKKMSEEDAPPPGWSDIPQALEPGKKRSVRTAKWRDECGTKTNDADEMETEDSDIDRPMKKRKQMFFSEQFLIGELQKSRISREGKASVGAPHPAHEMCVAQEWGDVPGEEKDIPEISNRHTSARVTNNFRFWWPLSN